MKRSILFVFISICFVLINAQAPGDFSDNCRTDFYYYAAHNWIPYVQDISVGVRGQVKWQLLIDQYDYINLLGSEELFPRVWTARDFDGDAVSVCILIL